MMMTAGLAKCNLESPIASTGQNQAYKKDLYYKNDGFLKIKDSIQGDIAIIKLFSNLSVMSVFEDEFLYLYNSCSGVLRLQKCHPPLSIMLLSLILSSLQKGLFLNLSSLNHCGDFKNSLIQILLHLTSDFLLNFYLL